MPGNPFRAGQNVDTIDVLNLSFGLIGFTDQFRIAAESYQGNSGNYKLRITMYKLI